jgi:hypothetical protein
MMIRRFLELIDDAEEAEEPLTSEQSAAWDSWLIGCLALLLSFTVALVSILAFREVRG